MKRLLSMLLALVLALGLLPAGAFAASSEEEALGEINIFNGGYRMNYLAMNGQVQSQNYVYYLFDTGSGTKEIPAYCVTPNQPGVQKNRCVRMFFLAKLFQKIHTEFLLFVITV